MKNTKCMVPSIISAVAGALALAFVGFVFGGWVTSGKSMVVADEMARKQVVAAMVPICIEQSKRDPDAAAKLADLKAAVSYNRNDMLMQTGWATMPGSSEPLRMVGEKCMDELEKSF